jgi:single-stranded-DNA-specific exonuclease
MAPTVTAAPQWVLHPNHAPEAAGSIARSLGAPLALGHALVNRGVGREDAARRYLDPVLEDLHEPTDMLDLDRAAERVLAAVAAGERVFVHGDYDVDGITSTFLLYSAIEELGGRAEFRIPHRIRDGYGLTPLAIDEAHRRGCGLVVTVDCGITATEAVAHASTLGIDTVITDHHEPPARLPDAVAIVNPLRPGCTYPFKSLAGVGVTFKLVERLLRGRGGLDRARRYLDAVALGTIADVVPLVGENRVLARLGLDRLNHEPRLGLRALIAVSSLAGKRITSGHVAFVLAPRINAAGRMGNAEQGLRLLLARDPDEAETIARSLEEDNVQRRKYDEQVLLEATRQVEQEVGYPDCSSILLWSDRWHPGVIGIVASRLVERFQRPTILVALDGERGRGSGRSLPGLDLTQLLDGCGDLLLAHGGHAFRGRAHGAARTAARAARAPRAARARAVPARPVRAAARAGRRPACRRLRHGAGGVARAHGPARPRQPRARVPHARRRLEQVQEVGAGKHLRLRARDDSGEVEAIGFGMGERATAARARRAGGPRVRAHRATNVRRGARAAQS